ncbi:MAG: thioredoxin [Candidatus Fonsibacter ubiquis]|nr:thioredoxin [Candidatus Fonsibacter ubiquis]
MFFLRKFFKYLVYSISLLLFITNHSLPQPIKDLPFKNIVVHEIPKEITGEEFIDFSGKKLKFNKFDHHKKKTDKFLSDLKIKNFSTYYDPEYALANRIGLRGLPTTLIIDQNSKELARVIGSIDFADEKFVFWLKNLQN